MATLVLTAVGSVLGGPIGAAIGSALGQVVDNRLLFAPKGREGPRLSDLRLQTSRYGDQIPKIFGTMRVAGSVIWATDLQERRTKKGGGKGQPSVTAYSYSASFAVALSSRRIIEVRRIWADGNLLRGAAGDFKTAVSAYRLHDGGEDQALDPLIAAHKGIVVTPAHRGIAYAVFEDLQLADYGNRIPSLTFEVVADLANVPVSAIAEDISGKELLAGTLPSEPALRGYAAGGASVADALAPLADSFDLALRSDASGMHLSPAGASEADVTDAMIAAALNGKPEPERRFIRGRAEDVPVRLHVRYYDPARDYQAGVQSAERAGPGRKEADLDLPAVVDAGEARALSEGRLLGMWTARKAMEVHCDWRALTLEAGAVVTIAGHPGRWRIERREWEGMSVRLSLRQMSAAGSAIYGASAGDAVAQPDLLHGATILALADLPVPEDVLPASPIVVVAAAGAEPGWRAAELFVEDVVTGGLASIGRTAPRATMGTVLSIPAASLSAHLFDTLSSVDIQLLNDGMTLSGADDSSLINGANQALLGREVIQFGEAVQTGPATWRLGRLLRGRRGTEWAIGGHAPGERFLLIEEDALAVLPAAKAPLGSTLRIRAIGIGDTTPALATEIALGQAVLPLSPVHGQAEFIAGEWRLKWVRRSRIGWRWNDGADAPLGEEQQLFRIDLAHGGAIFRTVTVPEPQWIYDAAGIAADQAAGIGGAVTAGIRQIGTHGMGRPLNLSITI